MPTAIHRRIDQLRVSEDPLLIARMSSGWAVMNEQQPATIPGCCVLLADLPVGGIPAHLNELGLQERAAFMADLLLLGDAVSEATGAERLNYLILCNQAPALHAHCIPRYGNEEPRLRLMDPFAAYDFATSQPADPTGEHASVLTRLRESLQTIMHRSSGPD